jgi:hypothetical protein
VRPLPALNAVSGPAGPCPCAPGAAAVYPNLSPACSHTELLTPSPGAPLPQWYSRANPLAYAFTAREWACHQQGLLGILSTHG